MVRQIRESGMPTLPEEALDGLGASITEDVRSAVNDMGRGKSPGTDGFPIEVYVEYIDLLAPQLVKLFNAALEEGQLPPSMRQALITVLRKPGKDKQQCRSYHPISLINKDTKILSKILTDRLSRVILQVVHEDHAGFISGRNTTWNLRRVALVEETMESEGMNAAVVGRDAEKAFDSVCWKYMFQVLQHTIRDRSWIQWVKLLYIRPTGRIKTNNVISTEGELGWAARCLPFCLP